MRTTKRRRGGTSSTQLLCGASHGAQFVGGSDVADGAMPSLPEYYLGDILSAVGICVVIGLGVFLQLMFC